MRKNKINVMFEITKWDKTKHGKFQISEKADEAITDEARNGRA